ncbi:MAG: TerC family protein [Bacteroidetes bacterium]|nr:TerC family protein [Bacteroidota bacterium]
MLDSLATLALLIGLELVLGIDNILVISIFVSRLEEAKRNTARITGLALALIARILLLGLVLVLAHLTDPVLYSLSVRDMLLLAGGLFLLYKAVKEIHATVELHEEELRSKPPAGFAAVITQIVLLDIVFSLDSVITAVGLTDELWVIITAVVLSFSVILIFARPVGDFILDHPALKILALAFLVTIGVTIFMEGLHKDVPKAYIYLPMGFALLVELLQMRYTHNRRKREGIPNEPPAKRSNVIREVDG